MKKSVIAVIMLFSPVAFSCEKTITLELSQSHFTLSIWEHVKDSANSVEIKLPTSCEFYDKIKVGDELLDEKFRMGSFLVKGSVGNWHLKVKSK